MENCFTPAPRALPLAGYIGGKRNLAGRIVPIIESVPHRCYAEPFVGAGGMFFRRELKPSVEVINDISRDVATLFRILQRHYPQFLDTLKWQLSSRAEFERLMQVDPATRTDLERAGRFLYLQRLAWGGKVKGRTFGVDVRSQAGFDLTKLVPMLEAAHTRLSSVTIECLGYDVFITKYDHADTLFYLDPPYWGCEDDYGDGVFSPDDFARMAAQLRELKGCFILSINDRPEVREIFDGFAMREVDVVYHIATRMLGEGRAFGELIISNLPQEALDEPSGRGLFSGL
ncbi:MAG: DNA adenine methylase [Burkholderia sp.]|nr:DNA adenine methylase [Alphaproteobacteria bacterium]MCA3797277.1 DNA adenine methylase [Burkholderia sp.]